MSLGLEEPFDGGESLAVVALLGLCEDPHESGQGVRLASHALGGEAALRGRLRLWTETAGNREVEQHGMDGIGLRPVRP